MADSKENKEEEPYVPNSLANPPNFQANTDPYPSITTFQLRSEKDIRNIETAFNTFSKILNSRKDACLKFANESVANYKKEKGKKGGKGGKGGSRRESGGPGIKSEMIVMDVDRNKSEFIKLATAQAQTEYALMIEEKACITKTREYMYYQDFNKKAAKELEGLQDIIKGEEDNLNKEKEAYKQELQTVLPPLADASKKLKKITKEQLVEFKSLKQPARIIISVVKCVAMMVGDITILNEKHYREWKDVKKLIAPELIEKMRSFDFDIKDAKAIQNRDNIDQNWIAKKNITADRAKQSNPTAGILMDWLIKMIALTKLREKVAPLEIKIDELSEIKVKKEKQGKKLQELIDANEKKMKKIHSEMHALVNKINGIRDEIESIKTSGGAPAE